MVTEEMLNVGVTAIDVHGTKLIDSILPLFENYLQQGKSEGGADTARQSVVVLFGMLKLQKKIATLRFTKSMINTIPFLQPKKSIDRFQCSFLRILSGIFQIIFRKFRGISELNLKK